MRTNAYVKVRKGNFPDVNYYMAWKGFTEIGYDVIKFEEEEQDTIEITPQTPCFLGVGACRKLIKRAFGWDYTGINPYPTELTPFMYRQFERKKWEDAREAALEGHMFIKPCIQKQFTGTVLMSLLDTIRTGKVDPENEVYVVEPVNFVSEWRVYVQEHEIIRVLPYFHKEPSDYMQTPDYAEIVKMIEAYKPSAPISYGLDVGIIDDNSGLKTALVEINDGVCLGNYGLDPIHYAEMISSRWLELTTNGHV